MHIIKWESNINKKGISDHKRRKKGGKKAHDQECKSMSISLTPIETNKSSREDSNRISGLYIPLNYTSFSPFRANNTPTTLYPLQDDVLRFYCNSSSGIFVPPRHPTPHTHTHTPAKRQQFKPNFCFARFLFALICSEVSCLKVQSRITCSLLFSMQLKNKSN